MARYVGFRTMRRRQKIKKYIIILSLLLVTFILSIGFADAKNGKWKPGNENDRRFPTDRTLQNDGRIPTGKTIENNRTMPIEEKIQNDRRISNDKILQNGRRIPTGKTAQNDRRLQIDGNMQNDRRIPIDRTFQNDRRILTGQNDRMHIDRKIRNDRILQYKRRVHSASITDRIMQEDGRKRINRILKNDRLSKNELQKKIDSLTQNKNIEKDNRVHDGRRMLNVRMQNDRKTQNDLKVQNARKILDERNQEMINARTKVYENGMWAATPHRTAQQSDWAASPQHIARQHKTGKASKFNSSEFISPNYTMPEEEGKRDNWGQFWNKLIESLGTVHRELPFEHLWLITRACHIIATTQISAQVDHRKYFTVRYFYENNLAYEVGYLVNEIVSKYQRMLELYDLATQYYFKHQGRFYAPSTYVLYVYTNVLEMGTVITHLCNMLNEMEAKYKYIPVNQSGFSDYHLQKRVKTYNADDRMAAQVAAYEKALAKLKRQKQRQNKKNRAKDLKLDIIVTTPDRRPKYSNFPLAYGWSIEDTW